MLLTKLRSRHTEEGFTLIELIIVVVIIGILSAVAIPIFMNQQRAAHIAGLQSDLRNVALLTAQYGPQKLDAASVELGWGVIKSEGTDVAFPISSTTWQTEVMPPDFPSFTLTEGNTIGITYQASIDRFCVLGYSFNSSEHNPGEIPPGENRWTVAMYYDPIFGKVSEWEDIDPEGGCESYIGRGING